MRTLILGAACLFALAGCGGPPAAPANTSTAPATVTKSADGKIEGKIIGTPARGGKFADAVEDGGGLGLSQHG